MPSPLPRRPPVGQLSPDFRQRLGQIVLHEAPFQVAVIDRKMHVVCTNPGFDEVFTARADFCFEAFKGRTAPCEECPALATFADGRPRHTEEEGVTRQGDEITYRVKAVPVSGPEQEVEHVLLMTVDITREAELEQGLEQAERLASVGLTLAGMAHTIKNILAGLEGGIYVVDSGLQRDNPDRMRGGWEMVQQYIEQLTALVKNLLRFSRPGEPVRTPVAPKDMVKDVVQLFESKAELVNVELVSRVEEGLVPLSMDQPAIHACLSNLVSNSLDACVWDPDDRKAHRIVLTARPSVAGGVVFEVSDNGMGISEEDQKKIMSAFFTTKGIRGTGLGLLLTRKTVLEHGGTISFNSTQGQGATFFIEIPSGGAMERKKQELNGASHEQEDTGH